MADRGHAALADVDCAPPFSEHHVPGEQGRVYARDYAGAGAAFMLMHGFPDNLHIYDALIPQLVAAGRRVVAFDFLGFGASEKPAAASYSFAQQLGDLKAVVDHLRLGKIVPVAHDASGMAALNFALDRPESTASLVILNAAYAHAATIRWPEMIMLFATPQLKALAGAILQSPPQFGWLVNFQREKFKAGLSSSHKAGYDAILGPIIDGNFRNQPGAGPAFAQMTADFFDELARNSARLPRLQALDVPVKVIWGERDPYLDVGLAEDFRSHFKRASLRLIQAGHWLQIDEPELVAAAMLGVIEQPSLPRATRNHLMSQFENPRVHADRLPALAAAVGPTTKILAIGSVTAKGTPEAIAPILPFEVRATVRNHLAGKIEQWFFQTEGYGVVFIMNVASTAEAHEILEKLPLGQAGMMDFELIALGPLAPLALLIGEPPRS